MAKKETNSKVPSKFKKTGKSFLPKLLEANTSSFVSFPNDLSFNGKEEGEDVVLIVRSHWVVYIPQLAMAVLILLVPFILHWILPQDIMSGPLVIGLIITAALISLTIVVTAFIKWFYNVNIVTDQRVLDLDFINVLSHTLSEAQLEKIEDVSHTNLGVISSIFDIGTVYIQTAGAKAEIEFQNIPRPRDVQDVLYDLLELKQKGKI